MYFLKRPTVTRESKQQSGRTYRDTVSYQYMLLIQCSSNVSTRTFSQAVLFQVFSIEKQPDVTTNKYSLLHSGCTEKISGKIRKTVKLLKRILYYRAHSQHGEFYSYNMQVVPFPLVCYVGFCA